MRFRTWPRLIIRWGVLIVIVSMAAPLFAEDVGSMRSIPLLYRQECAACHIAYPPGMLPAASWQRILNGLPHHYGIDASLDPVTAKELASWLTAHAAAGTVRPAEDRVTRSSWFVSEHEEVNARYWKLPAVKRASNCAACHTRADQGDFNERFIRLPQ
ncbi:cytochrome C [Burkholderia sp. A27]|nr:cytochrome C [Burkholderia sp. A27]